MHTYDKVSAEMWVEVTPQEIHFTTLFDEIVFATEGETISYRAHTPDQSGPLHALFDEMCQRFENLHLVQSDS